MRGMKKSTWVVAAFLVPLAILFLFGPSGTDSDVEFKAHGIRVLVVALSLSALMLAASPLVSRRAKSGTSPRREPNVGPTLTLRAWVVVPAGIAFALAVLLGAQIAIFRLHFRGQAIALLSVFLQQAAFVLASLHVHKRTRDSGASQAVVPLQALIVIFSVFFALATPTILSALAQHLLAAPIDYGYLVFSIPAALIVAIVSVIRVYRSRG